MINKKSLWFLTLFSLILVLSIYYITMPSELLLTTTHLVEKENDSEPTVSVEESDILASLRVEADEAMMKEQEELQTILTSNDKTVEEKNEAYEKIKELNSNRGDEEKLENKILEKHNIKSFIKIDGNNIKVVIDSKEHSESIANNIMRTIQEEYDTGKYITVTFKNS